MFQHKRADTDAVSPAVHSATLPGVQTESLLSRNVPGQTAGAVLCPIVVLTVCSKACLLAARLLHCLHAGREIELRLFGMLGSHHSSAFARLAEML